VHAARESALSRVEPDADTDELTLPQGVGSTGPTGDGAPDGRRASAPGVPPTPGESAAPPKRAFGFASRARPAAPETAEPASAVGRSRLPLPGRPPRPDDGKRIEGGGVDSARPRFRLTLPARPTRPRAPIPDAKRELRAAIRDRKRAERDEVRRFTRRARHRALAGGISGGLVVLLVAGTAITVFSPMLSLRTITVAGTETLDPAAIEESLADQLGSPLAFVDEAQIAARLGTFPAVASYATRTVPPNELVVTVVERTPVAVVPSSGGFDLVDPAGVVLGTTPERPAGFPLVEVADGTEGAGFRAAAEVVLALPDSVATQVDLVTASTTDDVALTLAGGVQRVVWGSADDSELKARVLAGLLPQVDEGAAVEFDVSAPMAPFWRPL
jgi:cell division protein FtsQ